AVGEPGRPVPRAAPEVQDPHAGADAVGDALVDRAAVGLPEVGVPAGGGGAEAHRPPARGAGGVLLPPRPFGGEGPGERQGAALAVADAVDGDGGGQAEQAAEGMGEPEALVVPGAAGAPAAPGFGVGEADGIAGLGGHAEGYRPMGSRCYAKSGSVSPQSGRRRTRPGARGVGRGPGRTGTQREGRNWLVIVCPYRAPACRAETSSGRLHSRERWRKTACSRGEI